MARPYREDPPSAPPEPRRPRRDPDDDGDALREKRAERKARKATRCESTSLFIHTWWPNCDPFASWFGWCGEPVLADGLGGVCEVKP